MGKQLTRRGGAVGAAFGAAAMSVLAPGMAHADEVPVAAPSNPGISGGGDTVTSGPVDSTSPDAGEGTTAPSNPGVGSEDSTSSSVGTGTGVTLESTSVADDGADTVSSDATSTAPSNPGVDSEGTTTSVDTESHSELTPTPTQSTPAASAPVVEETPAPQSVATDDAPKAAADTDVSPSAVNVSDTDSAPVADITPGTPNVEPVETQPVQEAAPAETPPHDDSTSAPVVEDSTTYEAPVTSYVEEAPTSDDSAYAPVEDIAPVAVHDVSSDIGTEQWDAYASVDTTYTEGVEYNSSATSITTPASADVSGSLYSEYDGGDRSASGGVNGGGESWGDWEATATPVDDSYSVDASASTPYAPVSGSYSGTVGADNSTSGTATVNVGEQSYSIDISTPAHNPTDVGLPSYDSLPSLQSVVNALGG